MVKHDITLAVHSVPLYGMKHACARMPLRTVGSSDGASYK